MDQFDPWQVVSKQVFTLYSGQLISAAFVVVSRIGCLWVTGVMHTADGSSVQKVQQEVLQSLYSKCMHIC